MTTDAEKPGTERRWAELMEVATCGELSEAERIELDQLSLASEERRVERLVLAAVATRPTSAPNVTREDERLIDAVLAEHAQRGRRRRRFVWLSAAALLVPLAAAAAYWPRSVAGKKAGERALAPARAAPSVATSGPTREREPMAMSKGEDANVQSPPSPAAPAASQPAPTAAELLARAQQARSVRDYAGAIHTYRLLLRLHPKSAVAPLAQISLAQLQLAQGDAKAALAGFEAYERSEGALSQEAHYGKIRALRALGRTADERAESRRFIERYPSSVQAADLRRRLGESDAGR